MWPLAITSPEIGIQLISVQPIDKITFQERDCKSTQNLFTIRRLSGFCLKKLFFHSIKKIFFSCL